MLAVVLLLCLLTGCGTTAAEKEVTVFEASFLTLFDTVTFIKGTAESKEAFEEKTTLIHDELQRYHQFFDIYNDYEGLNNIKTINDQAGVSPVTVDPEIIALLQDCVRYYEQTGGKTNVAMGSVLRLWHDARNDGIHDPENAVLPEMGRLEEAARYTDIGGLVIDEVNSTVYLSNPNLRLDVGAVAKGWSVQRVAEKLPSGFLISVGGNVCATGPKFEDTPWVIGIQDPASDEYLHTLYVNDFSVVTSGDYQRAYMVDGKMYHHIIDPETLMPAAYWRSVTVVCPDSGLADAMSTALFLLPLEQGMALAEKSNVQALWVNAAGEEFMTSRFMEMIRT